MRRVVWFALMAVAVLGLAACGSSKKTETETNASSTSNPVNQEAQAACSGSPLSTKPDLPPSWPQIEADKMTYTKQEKTGPTVVVEGYFNGDIKEAHDEWKKELQASGYKILFNELEDHDSEVSWSGEGRSGQVALREECGSPDKIWVHITNRPA